MAKSTVRAYVELVNDDGYMEMTVSAPNLGITAHIEAKELGELVESAVWTYIREAWTPKERTKRIKEVQKAIERGKV